MTPPVGRSNSNLSLYLPELLPTLTHYAETQNAKKSQEILKQLITAFSPEQKNALFQEIKRGNVPSPLNRLNNLIVDLGQGQITTAEFLKKAEKLIGSTRTVDGETVRLPSPAKRLEITAKKLDAAIKSGKLSEKELEVYNKLQAADEQVEAQAFNDAAADGTIDETEKIALDALRADRGAIANRFLDLAGKSTKGNTNIGQIKQLATAAAEAEREESTQEVALLRAAAGGSIEEQGSGGATGSTSSASRSSGSRSSGGATGSTSSAAKSSGGTGSTRSAAKSSGALSSGGDFTSLALSPKEQELYDKLKAEDPAAAAKFMLQTQLAKISELAAMLSNIAKMRHDAAMAIIGNMR